MKFLKFAVLVFASLFLLSSAYAEEAQPAQQPKVPFVQITNYEFARDEFKINTADFPNGIFVLARKKPIWSSGTFYPKVKAMAENILKTKYGIKIAETQESASAVLVFNNASDFTDLAEIEAGGTDSSGRAVDIASNIFANVLAGKLSGPTGIVTNGVNLRVNNKRGQLAMTLYDKEMNSDSSKTTIMWTKINYDEDNYLTTTSIFAQMIDLWAKDHVVTQQTEKVSTTSVQ